MPKLSENDFIATGSADGVKLSMPRADYMQKKMKNIKILIYIAIWAI
ncbi:MAG: hypothetical protein LBV04_03580 [Deferribacteraceae bacterium]|nr:hypothetical protein [Deferribacteraceae bacterium]